MSHIDRALRVWEGKGRVPVDPPPERFRLDQYVGEAATATAPPQERQPAKLVAPVARTDTDTVRPNTVPTSTVPAELPDPALEARLVTGSSGPVPLEQYRRLAAILHDLQLQQGLKTLMLTSALPHEGKTLTIVNLALTLSESYARRVLIIDADLRWPSVHTVLGVGNDTGLSEALLGGGSNLPIQQVSPRLSVLPAGRPGPTPLAALTSTRMGALVDECAQQFDWVLLDTPPVGMMPDAQLMARLTRAVVLVIAAGVTPAAAVQRAVEELGSDSIIGTVLNRVAERRIPEVGYYSLHGAPDQ